MIMRLNKLLVPGATATLVLAMAACGSDDGAAPSPNNNAGVGGDDCWPTAEACKLPNGAGFECLALHDNADQQVWSLRMSQLDIDRPAVLAGGFVQTTVVSRSITLNLQDCLQDGWGRFNWLLEFKPAEGDTLLLTTGGAHISSDPTGQGYCYIQGEIDGFPAQPRKDIVLAKQADGTYQTTEPIEIFNVPVFLDDNEQSSLMLPLHDVLLSELRLSDDHNCIGSWDGDGLNPDNACMPDPTIGQDMQWKNGAKLSAFITIEEAERVWIPDLGQTLCVALGGDIIKYSEQFEENGRKGRRCKRDEEGRILVREKADWCSSTKAACSPPDADAFRLEGYFAASGVKITETCP